MWAGAVIAVTISESACRRGTRRDVPRALRELTDGIDSCSTQVATRRHCVCRLSSNVLSASLSLISHDFLKRRASTHEIPFPLTTANVCPNWSTIPITRILIPAPSVIASR